MAGNTESVDIKPLTQGEWEVFEVVGFNARRKSVIITSNALSPIQKNVLW